MQKNRKYAILVGMLNYAWIETLLQRFRLKREKIPFIILSNLVLYY